MVKRQAVLILGLLAMLLWSCAGSGGSSRARSIVLTPTHLFVAQGQTVPLTANLEGLDNQNVTFTATAGTINQTGPNTITFTAPNVLGAVTVTATSVADPSLVSSAVVEVVAPGVHVFPNAANLISCQFTDITATVIGPADKSVTWQASDGEIIDLGGGAVRFRAPHDAGTYTITATSVADPSLSGTATINVTTSPSVIRGRVRRTGTGTGVVGVVVRFFDGNGDLVGQTTTQSDGTFGVEVPMTAERFHLQTGSFSTATFYPIYRYLGLHYDTSIGSCTAPLPEVCGNLEVTLPGDIILITRSGNVEPEADGCS